MTEIVCRTQAEFESAARGSAPVSLVAGSFLLDFAATPQVITLRGSSSLEITCAQFCRVVARDSSSVEAWRNSSVVAWGSSSVVAWDNSSVEAWGDVFIRVYGGRRIKAAPSVIVKIHAAPDELDGGQQIRSVEIGTVQDWCAYHGVKVAGEKALLFKGVKADFMSDRGGDYTPGTIPVCADWDGGVIECGRGYHVSPHPRMTREFCTPEKYVAGWVRFDDMAIHPNGAYPHKVKIRGYSDPVWECDADGNAVGNGERE